MHTHKTTEGATRGRAIDPSVQTFMDRFAEALTAGDAKTIATMWETPAFVLHDGGAKVVASRAEVEAFFSGAKEQYQARGISEARADIVSTEWLTDKIVTTRVRWPYIDASGAEIGEESSTYTLGRGEDGALKMRAIVMHGEKKPRTRTKGASA